MSNLFNLITSPVTKITLWLCLMVFLGSCQTPQKDIEGLNGRIILWHSWTATEATVLAEALNEFKEINPGVTVVVVALPPEELLSQYIRSATDGFGPDLFFGSNEWIRELAQAQLIRPLEATDIKTMQLENATAPLVAFEQQLYGVPLALNPRALYYNYALVTKLPVNLDELLVQAADEKGIAFVPRFEEAYWGIQTFGQGLFDENGVMNLPDSGFIEWLDWLNEAQNKPGVILNVDSDSLVDLFVQGKIAYHVASPTRQEYFTEKMGADAYGVTILPGGDTGPSGPLLLAEAIMFYTFSSEEQANIALALARFLTNQQQSVRFMRVINKVPANPQVQVDPRLYPTVAGFYRQSKTAVILPNEIPEDKLYASGDRAYANVLSGVLTPTEAVCRFGQEVSAYPGFESDSVILPEGCSLIEQMPTPK